MMPGICVRTVPQAAQDLSMPQVQSSVGTGEEGRGQLTQVEEDVVGVVHGDVDAGEVDGSDGDDGDPEGAPEMGLPEDFRDSQLPCQVPKTLLLLEFVQHLNKPKYCPSKSTARQCPVSTGC